MVASIPLSFPDTLPGTPFRLQQCPQVQKSTRKTPGSRLSKRPLITLLVLSCRLASAQFAGVVLSVSLQTPSAHRLRGISSLVVMGTPLPAWFYVVMVATLDGNTLLGGCPFYCLPRPVMAGPLPQGNDAETTKPQRDSFLRQQLEYLGFCATKSWMFIQFCKSL